MVANIQRARIVKLLSWVGFSAILISAAIGSYALSLLVQAYTATSQERVIAFVALEDAFGDAAIELGGQVQEWKDVLLRFDDPILHSMHLDGFRARHTAVQADLLRAEHEMQKLGIGTAGLADLRKAHSQLTARYEDTLQQINPANHKGQYWADIQLRGIDRDLQERLRQHKESVEQQVFSQIEAIGIADSAVSLHSLPIHLLVLAIMFPGIALAAFLWSQKLLKNSAVADRHMRTIFEAIGDAVVVANKEGHVEYCNKTACVLLKLTEDEIRANYVRDLFNLFNEEGTAQPPSAIEIVLNNGCPVDFFASKKLCRVDGSQIYIEDSAFPVVEGEQLTGAVMIFRDVSARFQFAQQLQEEHELFLETFEFAAVGIAHVAPDGRWLRVNQKLCSILGYSESELRSLSFQEITYPEDLDNDLSQMAALLEGLQASYNIEKRYFHKSGEVIWANLSVTLIRDREGRPDHFISIVEDIQARKQAEMQALASQEQYEILFEQMPEGVLLINSEMRVIAFNREAMRQLECRPEILESFYVWDFEALDDQAEVKRRARMLQETGRDEFESQYRTCSGKVIDVQVSIQHIQLPGKSGVFQCLFRDISEQKRMLERMEYLAYYDQLTDLPNLRLLADRVERALMSAERRNSHVALLFVDLDHFKNINDTLGHKVGDQLLIEVGKRMSTCLRAEDTLARSGGDEFVIMMNDLSDPDAAAMTSRKLIHQLSETFSINDTELNISASIGISVYPGDGRSFDELLKAADVAMYHAKDSGRSAYRYYTEEVNKKAIERVTVERLLHKAIENSEFELFYQPQIDLQTRRIIGCEALIRWNHPEIGLIPPSVFIPVAEQSNLINQIGSWVMRAVCFQASEWQSAGYDLKVSFNVSARQFWHGDHLLGNLAEAIRESRVDPSKLEIEMTESLLLNPTDMQHILMAVREIGIHLALDDFGTGYSSLSYLRRFPIGIVKIDRSFVSDADQDADDAEMVRTIIGMAHNLKMSLVAEGIETAA